MEGLALGNDLFGQLQRTLAEVFLGLQSVGTDARLLTQFNRD